MIQRGSHTSLEEMKGRRQKATLMGLSRGLCSDDSVVRVAACSQRGDEAESPSVAIRGPLKGKNVATCCDSGCGQILVSEGVKVNKEQT